MVRVKIEPWDACIACMVCVAVCPEVFQLKGDRVTVVGDGNEGVVDDSLAACVEVASENCPVDIILLEEA